MEVKETFYTRDAEAWIRRAWIQHFDPKGKITEEEIDQSLHGMVARERAFGNYADGRVGWKLTNAIAFKSPVLVRGSLGLWDYQICRNCGCTDGDCRHCIEKTGEPCYWVKEDLCSACVPEAELISSL